MLSLRQVESVDVSSNRADPHARSKEFSIGNSYFRGVVKLSAIFRLFAIILGLSLSVLGAQLALAQLFGASLLYLPTYRSFAINTLLLAVPALGYVIAGRSSAPKQQFSVACMAEAVVVSLSACALRFHCPSAVVICAALVTLAIGNCAVAVAIGQMVSNLPELKTTKIANAYFCGFALCSVLVSVLLVRVVAPSLPGGLEIAASFILLGLGLVHWVSPDSPSARVTIVGEALQTSEQSLMPFFVPFCMTSIPISTVLILSIEQNWVLFPFLIHSFQAVCFGGLAGVLLTPFLIFKRYQLSQFCLPGAIALSLSFVMAISPGANQGFLADICLAILGALFVYSSVQILSRVQGCDIFSRDWNFVRLLLIGMILAVTIFVSWLQPYLDTISATMLIRYLGLEVVVSGSLAIVAALFWHSRSLRENAAATVPLTEGVKGFEASHDFPVVSVVVE